MTKTCDATSFDAVSSIQSEKSDAPNAKKKLNRQIFNGEFNKLKTL